MANTYAAIQEGVRTFDASCGGVGGCPFAPAATGNVATEDLLYMIHRMGLKTGVDIDKIIETAKWLEGPLENVHAGHGHPRRRVSQRKGGVDRRNRHKCFAIRPGTDGEGRTQRSGAYR